jgi:hypothetical protein
VFWTCSRVWRQPVSLARIDSTVAFQTKGLGFSFQTSRKSLIAAIKSGTLGKESRRIRLVVSSLNQRSIRLSQLQLVGTNEPQTADAC